MMSNNKILTVSYGTFSCTLEGFDDSFHTMKAIAEYFRDLASDDRYFGAEPPQPDAEMLARIAEREIARRVEARTNDGRIFLSATAPEAAAPTAPPRQETPAPQAAAAAPVAPVADKTAPVAEPAAPVTAAPATAAEAAEHSAPDLAPESDAVQLQDVDSGADAQENETETHDGIDDAFDHAQAGDMLAAAAPEDADTTAATAEAFFAESPTETAEDAIEDFVPHTQTAIAPEIAVAEDVAPPARTRVVPHADSIAAKLERIRAVVSQADDEDLDDDYSEDEHAEALVSETAHSDDAYEDEADDVKAAQDDALMTAMMAQAEGDDEDVAGEDTAADIAAQAAADVSAALDADDTMTFAEDDDDDVAAILARLDSVADAGADAESAADAVAESDETTEEDAPQARSEGQDETPDETVRDSEDLSDDSDDINLFDEDDDEEIMIVEEEDEADAAAATPAPRITRIVKVKRSELEAAIAQGNLEEMDDDDEQDAAASSSLSDEDEDALLRELAEVEADLTADEKDDIKKEVETNATRVAAAKLDAADDDDMDRLMAKADAEMGEPESARRRDAFAHLRAAVAAKNSDEGIVGAKIAEDALEVRAYQTDLADVVKPRRPDIRAAGSGARRPDVQRPAPLKLVAEQRVDSVAPAPVTPVRPRRVAQATAASETTGGANSFAEFADDMGAHALPDLLEAAAAYLAFVEERDQFSRPQLMTKVRQVVGADFSREDSLRSFGQLLRAGKIEKIKGGRFAVSGDIGFRPDQRAAG